MWGNKKSQPAIDQLIGLFMSDLRKINFSSVVSFTLCSKELQVEQARIAGNKKKPS
jgi:hypothetical protein